VPIYAVPSKTPFYDEKQRYFSSSHLFLSMPASLITTPAEVLEKIVLLAVRQRRQGPPSILRSLRLTCRMSNIKLSPESNSYLSFTLFMDRFDAPSPRRHYPSSQLTDGNLECELRKRFQALQRIRRGDTADPDILDSLSTIYIMMLEDDGRNWDQLLWAELPSFMRRFLRERLMVGAETNNGWPTENEVNMLAVSIFWLMSSSGSLPPAISIHFYSSPLHLCRVDT